MQLSLKPEIFSLLSVSNLKHFEKKDDRHGDFILEITDNERLGSTALWNTPFRTSA